MKEKYPCKNCIVRPCCTAHCGKLETTPAIMDMYIKIFNQCPDCGNNDLQKCTTTSQLIKCNLCNKIFEQQSFPKSQLAELLLMGYGKISWGNMPVRTVSLDKIIITDIYQKEPTEVITDLTEHIYPNPLSMSETHDLLYVRKSVIFTQRAGVVLDQTLAEAIRKSPYLQPTIYPKQKRIFKPPRWARGDKYPVVNQDPDCDFYEPEIIGI